MSAHAAPERSVAPNATTQAATAPLDVAAVRACFPVLDQSVHGKPLAYLDNAATSQTPKAVLDAMRAFYEQDRSNVHRGVHLLSERATKAFEDAREKVRTFIGARSAREIVFTRGTTEAINLVAASFARPALGPGDEILITTMEHHSNIVPWQLACEATGATLRVAPIADSGELILDQFEPLIGKRTRLVAIGHVSNALGTVNPVAAIVAMAKARGVPVLVDGAQAVPHLGVDVQALGCDFYAFSAHKMYGPMGIGALWAREQLLEAMPPWQGGGDMIASVSFEKSTWNHVPYKFEAGTPNVAGAIGMAAATDFIRSLGMARIAAHEDALLRRATQGLADIRCARIVGTAPVKASVLSFIMERIHPHDIGTILDRHGVAIRTGNHCAEPVMRRLGLAATARASLAAYNTEAEVDQLLEGVHEVRRFFLPHA